MCFSLKYLFNTVCVQKLFKILNVLKVMIINSYQYQIIPLNNFSEKVLHWTSIQLEITTIKHNIFKF